MSNMGIAYNTAQMIADDGANTARIIPLPASITAGGQATTTLDPSTIIYPSDTSVLFAGNNLADKLAPATGFRLQVTPPTGIRYKEHAGSSFSGYGPIMVRIDRNKLTLLTTEAPAIDRAILINARGQIVARADKPLSSVQTIDIAGMPKGVYCIVYHFASRTGSMQVILL